MGIGNESSAVVSPDTWTRLARAMAELPVSTQHGALVILGIAALAVLTRPWWPRPRSSTDDLIKVITHYMAESQTVDMSQQEALDRNTAAIERLCKATEAMQAMSGQVAAIKEACARRHAAD